MPQKPVMVSFALNDLALGDIMRMGCVGAERLWLNAYKPDFDMVDGRIEALKIGRPPGVTPEFDVPAMRSKITYQTLADALGVMAVTERDRHNAHLSRYFARVIEQTTEAGCAADMVACDTVLQVAVFGYVAYG